MTRIVHFSDFHSKFEECAEGQLPEADVYVCTGDMFPNSPRLTLQHIRTGERKTKWNWELKGLSWEWVPIRREIIHSMEITRQTEWMNEHWGEGRFRNKLFASPHAPVICIRGNHDFIDLTPLFGGEVYEIHGTKDIFRVVDLTFGGCRGINYIDGEWSDELKPIIAFPTFNDLSRDIDVLVTHAPSKGLLDYSGDNYGMVAIRDYVDKARNLRAHLFGHIHEQGGKIEDHEWSTPFSNDQWLVKLSNAATKVNVIDL